MKRVELLAPAGDLEKLKIAILYGADAVSIGGKKFSLRAKASNFTIDNIKEAFENGEITLLAATSATEEETAEWVKEIEAAFPGHKVLAGNLSLGVSCHTGAGALGVGYSRNAAKR